MKERRRLSKSTPPVGWNKLDIYAPMMPSFGSCAILRVVESVMCLVSKNKNVVVGVMVVVLAVMVMV
jgi:hypothetical protein